MRRETVLTIISYAFILLFAYTALSKWMMFDIYLYDLKRSPDLGAFAWPIAILVPGAEMLIVALLLFKRTQKLAFIGAFLLMVVFTLYVAYVLIFKTARPCTCGGIIRQLSWPNHFIFNMIFTILAALGYWLQNPNREPPSFRRKRRNFNPA